MKKILSTLILFPLVVAAQTLPSNTVRIGDGSASNKQIIFNKGGSNPQIRWSNSNGWFESSADGTNFSPLDRSKVAAKTANYTLVNSDTYVSGDATSGAFALTLPTAVGISGKVFELKKIDLTANALTVSTTSSQTIDGVTSYILSSGNNYLRVRSDGANWAVVGQGKDLQVVSKTANYTALISDDVITGATAGGAFTITLPSAVGIPGKVFSIQKTDSSANLLTVNTTSSQVIGTQAQTSTKLHRIGEIIKVRSTGSAWLYVDTDEVRTESAALVTGTPSISIQFGAWITSGSGSTGNSVWTLPSGIFSAVPICTCSDTTAGGVTIARGCTVFPTSTTSLTTYHTVMSSGSSTISGDGNTINITCRGWR